MSLIYTTGLAQYVPIVTIGQYLVLTKIIEGDTSKLQAETLSKRFKRHLEMLPSPEGGKT